MTELKKINELINAVKDNTYNLPKELELYILNLIYKELQNIECSPNSTCEYCENISSTGNNFYSIYCSYLDRSKQKKIYDFISDNFIPGCPFITLREEVNSLIRKIS